MTNAYKRSGGDKFGWWWIVIGMLLIGLVALGVVLNLNYNQGESSTSKSIGIIIILTK